MDLNIVTVDPVGMPDPSVREQITKTLDKMLDSIKEGDVQEAHPNVRHVFAPGVYAREMTLEKGQLIIGKIHKTAHINILSKGEVTVKTQFGVDHYVAPHTFVAPIGVQRVIYAHEDSVWTNIHPTDKTDPDEIEADVIASSYDEIAGLDGPEKLEIK